MVPNSWAGKNTLRCYFPHRIFLESNLVHVLAGLSTCHLALFLFPFLYWKNLPEDQDNCKEGPNMNARFPNVYIDDQEQCVAFRFETEWRVTAKPVVATQSNVRKKETGTGPSYFQSLFFKVKRKRGGEEQERTGTDRVELSCFAPFVQPAERNNEPRTDWLDKQWGLLSRYLSRNVSLQKP